MTTMEFVELVKNMRTLQKQYFTSRSTNALNAAKNAERNVDAALRAMQEPTMGI